MQSAPNFLATSLAVFLLTSFPCQGHAATQDKTPPDPRNASIQLARSLAIDTRCKILSPAERQDLKDFVARAEIALASRYSVKMARDTLGKGRAEGKIAPCDSTASAQVKAILQLARQATADAPMVVADPAPALAPQPQPAQAVQEKPSNPPPAQMAAAEPKPAEPVAVAEPQKVAPVKKPVLPKKVKAPVVANKAAKPPQTIKLVQRAKDKPTRTNSNLASYANLAEDYYVELKCRSMPTRSVQRMYADVLVQHRAALASGGAAAVGRLLRNAQYRAGQRGCG